MATRAFDIAVSLLGLCAFLPLLLVLAAAVRLHDGGPVLYCARRVGRRGGLFTLYKFRSMIVSAEKNGSKVTKGGDERVTWLGKILRSYKLDELPQLYNVLKGDMSFVGPRPEDPHYVNHYTPEQRQVLDRRPGITSPATLRYRKEETMLSSPDWENVYLHSILPHKLEMELEYQRNRTFRSDLVLILRTIRKVPQGGGR